MKTRSTPLSPALFFPSSARRKPATRTCRRPLRPASRLATLVAAATTMLGGPAGSQAQRAGNPQGQAIAQAQSLWRHLDAGLDSLAGALSLTADQKEQIAGLTDAFRAANAEALAGWNAMRRDMRRAMADRDRAAMGEARRRWAEEYGDSARRLTRAFAALKEDVEAALDDEQREKLDGLVRDGIRRRTGG